MAFHLFGDESLDTHSFLSKLLYQEKLGILSKSFLDQVCASLRDEIDLLPVLKRQRLPTFSSISQLNERYHATSKKNAAIDSVLLVTTQLAHYIDCAEKFRQDAPIRQDTCLVGLCMGLLAATAVSTATSLSELVPRGVQFALLAFRIGSHVAALADRLQNTGEIAESWTHIVPGLDGNGARQMLEAFNRSQNLPSSSQVYLSALASSSGSVISGPPSTLRKFFATNKFHAKSIPLPVHGPYHAPHLHVNVDLEDMLHLDDPHLTPFLQCSTTRVPIISCSKGSLHSEQDLKSLIIAIVHEILIEPLMFHCILARCIAFSQNFKHRHCEVVPFGPTNAAATLQNMLKDQTDLGIDLCKPFYSAKADDSNINSSKGGRAHGKLAIVGMAGRFPDAASHEKLWELLEAGLDVHREVPPDRFDVKTHVDPTGKAQNTSHTPYGCWIENPGLFDPRFFNMSPREAYQTDPMQRMALTTAYEALEMSGYVPNRTRSTKLDRIGTFYGQTSDDWREINAAQDVDTYFITGGVRAFGPGRINYHFGFSGPSFSIDTACSSSMAAMQLACTSLWAHDCDTAIVGGLSCMTNSDIFAGLSRGQFLSKNGPCATFDNDADGYCRADACGTVIVKRLEDALADKDNILATVLASATNHSADAISITHPHGETQELLYQKIMDIAGVDPLEVDYVEMHGTGTQAGDGTEMLSVTNIFAPADRRRSLKQPLYLGAVKANVGHGEAASGVTAVIKCLLMLRNNSIPPHVGIKNTINKAFPKDLAKRNVNIAYRNTPWPTKVVGSRRIFVNNFSAAGGNSGLLLEDGPLKTCRTADSRSTHVVSVSAKSKSALIRNSERLLEYLDTLPDISLADLAYTTTARRIQHNWRIGVTASDISQVRENLALKLTEPLSPIYSEPPKIVFTFTGQGSHYASLGKDLFETSKVFRDAIIGFHQVSKVHGFPSFLPLIDGSTDDISILSPIAIQLGLLCFEMAVTQLWASWGVNPSVVIGHSLGEYAALNAAGVLSASDAIYLVGTRAKLLLDKCTAGTHAMLAVQKSLSAIFDILDSPTSVDIACINGPQDTVLSGDMATISAVAMQLAKSGVKCTQLDIPFAFHSTQVDPILDEFEGLASAAIYSSAKVPVVSTLFGRLLDDTDSVGPSYLRKHARDPVQFFDSLLKSSEAGVIDSSTIFLEIGPHPVCLAMVKATIGSSNTTVPTLRRRESAYKTISTSLASLHVLGISVDWTEFHRDFSHSLQLLDLPTYSFDEKNYWLQYTGDWCLTKNRVATDIPQVDKLQPTLSTTSVQKITAESVDRETATVSIESDLSKPGMRQAIMGHLVNGVALCPSSIYADMAMTVCDYAYKLIRPQVDKVGMNVSTVEVVKPLIADPDGKTQILKLTAKLDLSLGCANLIFSSSINETAVTYATCRVVFGDSNQWLSEWQRSAYLISSRIDWLKEAERDGRASKIGRGLVYKLFATLVDFDPKYRGMEEVILCSNNMEATSSVTFQTTEQDGNFFCSPYWIESVAHLAGFVVNVSDAVDTRSHVYVSHGWESLRIAEPFSAEKKYRSYVRMQPTVGKIVAGDVYVFDDARIVAVVGGLKFQCMPRSLLDTFLLPSGTVKSTQRPVRKPKVLQATAIASTVHTKIEKSQVSLDTLGSVDKNLASIWSLVLAILVKEIGVSSDELVDNIAFADLGVDSLMSLAVSGRLREELEIEIHSSAFIDHPTIKEFKTFLSKFEDLDISSSQSVSSEDAQHQSTPDIDDSSFCSTTSNGSGPESRKESPHRQSPPIIIASGNGSEYGSQGSEISLLGLGPFTSDSIKRPPVSNFPNRQATSVLLQGSARRAKRFLWMIPDGGGSATSYTAIPEISPTIAVWGLNSPYMKVPEEYNCGVVGMAEKFIVEMKRRQTQGPYMLAGWSAGGVIAFEVTNQLLKAGDEVERLILIDAPCPLIIEPLPTSLHRWFASIGLLGDGDINNLPPWLLPHFAASVAALSSYTAESLDPTSSPQVTAIWCEDGVCHLPTDPRPDPFPYGHAQFLLDNRTDFGPGLWDTYIPMEKLITKRTPGNHFSMMGGAYAKQLRNIIHEAVESLI